MSYICNRNFIQCHFNDSNTCRADEDLQNYCKNTTWPQLTILTHNDDYDRILFPDGAVIKVTDEIFQIFYDGPPNGPEEMEDNGNWEDWSKHSETIEEAAKKYGEIVAYYKENANGITLQIIKEEKLWEDKIDFIKH